MSDLDKTAPLGEPPGQDNAIKRATQEIARVARKILDQAKDELAEEQRQAIQRAQGELTDYVNSATLRVEGELRINRKAIEEANRRLAALEQAINDVRHALDVHAEAAQRESGEQLTRINATMRAIDELRHSSQILNDNLNSLFDEARRQ